MLRLLGSLYCLLAENSLRTLSGNFRVLGKASALEAATTLALNSRNDKFTYGYLAVCVSYSESSTRLDGKSYSTALSIERVLEL